MTGSEEYGEGKEPIMIRSTAPHLMAYVCIAADGTGSLVFIDDVTADKSSRMNTEMYRDNQPNDSKLTGQRFTVQKDNDPKYTRKQPKLFLRRRSGIFCDDQVNCLI